MLWRTQNLLSRGRDNPELIYRDAPTSGFTAIKLNRV